MSETGGYAAVKCNHRPTGPDTQTRTALPPRLYNSLRLCFCQYSSAQSARPHSVSNPILSQ